MEDVLTPKFKEVRLYTLKLVGQLLILFAGSAGISHRKYYKLLSSALGKQLGRQISAGTVKRYTTRGIPQTLSYSDLSAAIEQAYQTYCKELACTAEAKAAEAKAAEAKAAEAKAAKANVAEAKAAKAKATKAKAAEAKAVEAKAVAEKAHNEYYPHYFSLMNLLDNPLSNLEKAVSLVGIDVRMQVTADLFYRKKFFKEGQALSKEEADFLVESVLKYPPKYFEKAKAKNKT